MKYGKDDICKTKDILVRVTPELHERTIKYSKQIGKSLSELIRDYLEKITKEES